MLKPLAALERCFLELPGATHREVFSERAASVRWTPAGEERSLHEGSSERALASDGSETLTIRSGPIAALAELGRQESERLHAELQAARDQARGQGLATLRARVTLRSLRVALREGARERQELHVEVACRASDRILTRHATSAAALSFETSVARPARRWGARLRTLLRLAPRAAGTLLHELVGHAVEERFGDRALLAVGARIGPAELNVYDDPSEPGLAGSYEFDDEGTSACRLELVRAGQVVGAFCDRRSALLTGRSPSGHGRRESFREPPLPRMANFRVEPCGASEALPAAVEVPLVSHAEASLDGREARLYAPSLRLDDESFGPAVVTVALAALRDLKIGADHTTQAFGFCGRDGQRIAVSSSAPSLFVEGEIRARE